MKKSISLPLNPVEPRVMHIDLNSCFAIIEQQANRLLRGRAVGVAAYDTPRGFVLAASYEAKHKGIKLGVNVAEARAMCPGIVIMTPDPSKYREAHRRFKELMLEYTSDVTPKSIDEFVLDLSGSPALRAGKSPEEIGAEIKDKVRERLGEAVTVNVGIGPNRFLAKYAAGFGKPDGMTRIDHDNLRQKYANMDLVDLPGINVRYKRRLQMYGIMTPLDFLRAERRVLEKVVFHSIVGYYWYLRLRGYEIDKNETRLGSIGHQYALPHKTWDREELARLLMKLCEKVGRRLRKNGLSAGGIHLYLDFVRDDYGKMQFRTSGFIGERPEYPYADELPGASEQRSEAYATYGERAAEVATQQFAARTRSTGGSAAGQAGSLRKLWWHHGEKVGYRLYSTQSVYQAAKSLLRRAEIYNKVRGMSITVFDLRPAQPEQLSLLEGERGFAAQRHISDALDEINDRYGEFVVTPATMLDMQGEILDRIAFGSVREV